MSKIEIVRMENLQDGINEGFMVDALEVFVDDSPAGYLKMSYINPLWWDNAYPGVLSYAMGKNGSLKKMRFSEEMESLLPKVQDFIEKYGDFSNAKPVGWSATTLEAACRDMVSWLRTWISRGRDIDDEIAKRDMSGKKPTIRFWRSRFEKLRQIVISSERDYQSSIEWQVGKPYVDYIRVYEENEPIHVFAKNGSVWEQVDFSNSKSPKPRSKMNFRGNGLAGMLYVEGARWMAEKGMTLRSSSLQSPHAVKAWDRLEQSGVPMTWVERQTHYGHPPSRMRVLDFRKVNDSRGEAPNV